ncbi:MAG: redoxin domain-containing protein [bacterium]|nr:redoxin domain-containing protein [bacterium]
MKRIFTCVLVLVFASSVFAFQENDIQYEIGKKIDNFTLKDLSGNKFDVYQELSSEDVKGIAFVFISYKCPASRASDKRYIKHAADLKKKGILFVGIAPNTTETPEKMSVHAEKSGYNFPVLWDHGLEITDRFSAVKTPHAFFVDGDGVLRYDGRVDDNANNPKKVQERTLEMVIGEYLDGKDISVTKTKPQG